MAKITEQIFVELIQSFLQRIHQLSWSNLQNFKGTVICQISACPGFLTSEGVNWTVLHLQESVKWAPAAGVSSRVSRWRGPPGGGSGHCSCCVCKWARSWWKRGRGHGGGCCRLFLLRALEGVATGDWAPDPSSVHHSKRSYDDV